VYAGESTPPLTHTLICDQAIGFEGPQQRFYGEFKLS